MKQSILRVCLLAGGLLTAFTASAQSYVQTSPGFIAYVTDASAAASASGTIVHSFQLRNQAGAYPRLLQISDYGKVGIGNLNSWEIRSLLNVGAGMGSLAVDVLNGGACLGFNAMRQNYGNKFYFATNGTDNGGSLIWADPPG